MSKHQKLNETLAGLGLLIRRAADRITGGVNRILFGVGNHGRAKLVGSVVEGYLRNELWVGSNQRVLELA
ncbi:hypothetical protein [Stieleria varia]|uniref:Uncharacterized protein n=1 Tax=Stieleria varia TaxID=2528005 RepID=A0A5C6AGI7_9BACT|nr:hypothetical protein [Stieleria varia]TWT98537.1 hypothetical protein Pla52n_50530 [Stieleria varia]